MAETIQKLQPDRDLQCYFFRPSAIAALSSSSPTGFTLSGSWRQQADWAVVEWNRDNTFEHPQLRNLPDGDLSGLTLTYQEERTNCIPLDSSLYPTVDWPYLRVWLDTGSGDLLRRVRLSQYAVPAEGSYVAASATFLLSGIVTTGDLIELAWDAEHYGYILADGDTAQTALVNLANTITHASTSVVPTASGASIILVQINSGMGENGNRLGVYGTVSGANTELWQPQAQQFSGGASPTAWQVRIPFGSLVDADTGEVFSASAVRKMRWTFAADLQPADFLRTEFSVVVTNWVVSGTNGTYSVAGPGSHRFEDDSPNWGYTGTWIPSSQGIGNFSGGSIAVSSLPGSAAAITYTEPFSHQLFLGTRKLTNGASVSVVVDEGVVQVFPLALPSEDVLVRVPLGTFSGQSAHRVSITHSGTTGTSLYLDFLEIAYPNQSLPVFPSNSTITLATDWDTDHCLALAPERTAWLISKLGFQGRANNYAGALLFFELVRIGQIYATASIRFGGVSMISVQTSITLDSTVFTHLHLQGDSSVTVAKAFELLINEGSTGVWSQAVGSQLTITSRNMGTAGNATTLATNVQQANGSTFSAQASSGSLQGGVNGSGTGVSYQDTFTNVGWRTDISAKPILNRAVRDWSTSYFAALKSFGIEAVSAFSTELQFADPSPSAGLAQRYPSGNPVVLDTPAIQTNFSPASLAFWQEAHLEMAQLMTQAGQSPYVQFGEVQWWYFADDGSGLPFYDAYTEQQFQALYGRPLTIITSNAVSPASAPEECVFLPSLIGQFTASIITFVESNLPGTKFEVLYPPDVNNSPFTSVVNFPTTSWTPAALSCLKTENFTYTGSRNLDLAQQSVAMPSGLGFGPAKCSHLVGIGDYTTPWQKEAGLAFAANVESLVLFALDQFCLIGYPTDFYLNFARGGATV